MRFNREKFIDETTGDLGAALDIIDELVSMLNNYCSDNDIATGYGSGCYGVQAEQHLLDSVSEKFIGEFLEPSIDKDSK